MIENRNGTAFESYDPAEDCFEITPHDSTNFTIPARGLYVGVGGDVVVVTRHSTVVTFVGVLAGTVLPVRCIRVNSTDTTASSLVGLI